ncbi:hypothetical protein QTP88_004458 [Uroleucon formosanum]
MINVSGFPPLFIKPKSRSSTQLTRNNLKHTSALSGTLPIQDSDNMSLSHFVLAFFSNLICIVKYHNFSESHVRWLKHGIPLIIKKTHELYRLHDYYLL